jgi:hypothetical protein
MTMENTAIDIGRVLEDDEQSTTENTRMRPYLDIWDVSTHFHMAICPCDKFSALRRLHKTIKYDVQNSYTGGNIYFTSSILSFLFKNTKFFLLPSSYNSKPYFVAVHWMELMPNLGQQF